MGYLWRGVKTTIAGVDTTVMVTADALGTETSVIVPEKGIIESLTLTDLANQDAAIDILMFDDDITSGSNGVAYDMDDGDAPKYIGQVKVTAADYSSLGDNSVAVVGNVGLAYECPGGNMRVQCVVRGAPTYVTDALVLSLTVWVP